MRNYLLPALIVQALLSACATDLRRDPVQAETTTLPATQTITIRKPWTVAVLPDRRIVSLSHKDGVLAVWRISGERSIIPLQRDDAVGFHPDAVRVVDWDDDGRMELLVAAEGMHQIQLWEENEKGAFALSKAVGTALPPRDLAVADFDGDGKKDIVVGPYNGTVVELLWGRGDFVFERQALTAGETPSHPQVGDWDLDGDPDIVWSDWDSASIRLQRNQGGRKFVQQMLKQPELTQVRTSPRQVRLVDVDGDGWMDIVAALETGEAARIYYNDNGKGVRGTEDIPAPHWGYSHVGITRDGDELMLGLTEENRTVLVKPGTEGWELRQIPSGSLPLDPTFADLDGDGVTDFIVANSAEHTLTIVYGPLWERAQPIEQKSEKKR
jgi:WD40 repeat protein